MNRHKVLLDFENNTILFGIDRNKLRKRSLSPQGNIRRPIFNLFSRNRSISSADNIGSLSKLSSKSNQLESESLPQIASIFNLEPELTPKSASLKSPPKILPRLKPDGNKQEFITRMIDAAAYYMLAKNAKQDYTEIFAISMQDIDLLIAQDRIDQTNIIDFSNVKLADVSHQKLIDKLPF